MHEGTNKSNVRSERQYVQSVICQRLCVMYVCSEQFENQKGNLFKRP